MKKVFTTKTGINTHILETHDGKKANNICVTCEESFPSNTRLNKHIDRVHLKSNSFKCHCCDKIFSQKEDLKPHIDAVHNKKKNFNCENCLKAFFSITDLKRHVLAMHK